MMKLGAVDKFFAKLEKHWKLAFAFGVLMLALAFIFQSAIQSLITPHLPFLKLLALITGPVATIFGFYLGYKSKKELIDHTRSSEIKLVTSAAELSRKSETIGELNSDLRARTAELGASKQRLEEQTTELKLEANRVALLDANLRRVTDGGNELWKAYPARPFPQYYEWLRAPQGAKIVTIGNLKGGVGKTTIAANLAAYISTKREKPVLLIDLDYQGSLSNMMMFAAGIEEVPSLVNDLFVHDASLETIDKASIHLASVLSRAWIVPASYTLGSVEGNVLFKWLMEPDQKIDARYLLARQLLQPSVRQRFSMIIIDMPPRMTLGAVGALVASHHLIVPSALDKMSAEAVLQFLSMTRAIKADLDLDLDLLGAVGSLSRQDKLSSNETLSWSRIGEHCQKTWGVDKEFRFNRTIPRKERIAEAAGETVAYAVPGQKGDDARKLFDALGDEIWLRMFGPQSTSLAGDTSPQEELAPATIATHDSD
jgi:cellulose biosynthesis protein BcsQ